MVKNLRLLLPIQGADLQWSTTKLIQSHPIGARVDACHNWVGERRRRRVADGAAGTGVAGQAVPWRAVTGENASPSVQDGRPTVGGCAHTVSTARPISTWSVSPMTVWPTTTPTACAACAGTVCGRRESSTLPRQDVRRRPSTTFRTPAAGRHTGLHRLGPRPRPPHPPPVPGPAGRRAEHRRRHR